MRVTKKQIRSLLSNAGMKGKSLATLVSFVYLAVKYAQDFFVPGAKERYEPELARLNDLLSQQDYMALTKSAPGILTQLDIASYADTDRIMRIISGQYI